MGLIVFYHERTVSISNLIIIIIIILYYNLKNHSIKIRLFRTQICEFSKIQV